jgi:hypothetical protein
MVGSLFFVANLIAPLSLPDSLFMASRVGHGLEKFVSIQGPRLLLPALRGGCGLSAKAAHVTHDSLPKGTPPHNFGPATTRDHLVYGSFRPGFSEVTESAGAVKDEDVVVWAKFMSDQGVKRIVCLLNDDELQFYR